MNNLPDEFYILDTETTGLGETDEIVEIAILNQDGEAVLNTLIKPTQPIPDDAINTDRWVSLVAAAKHYDITFDGLTPHRAASDCAVTLDVLRAMYGLPPIATGELARNYEVVL